MWSTFLLFNFFLAAAVASFCDAIVYEPCPQWNRLELLWLKQRCRARSQHSINPPSLCRTLYPEEHREYGPFIRKFLPWSVFPTLYIYRDTTGMIVTNVNTGIYSEWWQFRWFIAFFVFYQIAWIFISMYHVFIKTKSLIFLKEIFWLDNL